MLLGGVEGTHNIVCHVHLIEVDKELRRIGYLRKFSGLWQSRRQGGERNRLQQITTGPHKHRLFPLVIGIVPRLLSLRLARPSPTREINGSMKSERNPFVAAFPRDSCGLADVPAWRILPKNGAETTKRK